MGAPKDQRRKVTIQAPEGADPLFIARAIVGPSVLLKAQHRPRWTERPFLRWKPLAGLYKRTQRIYRAQLKTMTAAIRAYVEKEVVLGKLVKAGGRPTPIMTPEQLQHIADMIRDHHQGFMVGVGVTAGVSPDAISDLVDRGLLPKETLDIIGDSFTYGQLTASLKSLAAQKALKAGTYEAFKRHVEKTPVPITASEQRAKDWSMHSAAIHMRGMGDSVADDVSTMAISGDATLRRKYMTTVRTSIDQGIEERRTWREIASDITEKTDDWSRDMMRVAATESQAAFQEGFAEGLIKREGDPDGILVVKLPSPNACKHCIRLHLESGYGSKPRVFKLSDLVANGTNVGVKANSWEAVVGPVHPWCFPGGTLVETEDGQKAIESLEAGVLVRTHLGRFRAIQNLSHRYAEGLIEVTFGEQLIRTTPEHPFLTPLGWARADSLKPGDVLLTQPHFPPLDGYPQEFPAKRFKQRVLECILPTLTRAVVPSGVNFNTHAMRWDSNVDVDDQYGVLWNNLKAVFRELLAGADFVGREHTLVLAGLSRLDLLDERPGLTANSAVCIFRNALSLFRSAALIHDQKLRRSCANGGTDLLQPAGDSTSGSTVEFRQLLDAFTSLVGIGDLFAGEFELSHDVHYHAVPVTSVQPIEWVGEVFNFSVEEDESYVVHGAVVHNCGCEMVHVPEGMSYESKPPTGEGWQKVPGKKDAWRRKKAGKSLSRAAHTPEILRGDTEDEWSYWSPQLVPDTTRKGLAFERDLMKSFMTFGDSVPERGCAVRVADNEVRREIDKVLALTPPQLFDKEVGVTLITTDIPRAQVALTGHDQAYWTGNEIRLSQTLPIARVGRVLRHELGHALNVYLIRKMGSVGAVRDWHEGLFKLGKKEGYVSKYASTLAIESAAEVTKLYLFNRHKLMLEYPRQFTYVHKAYKGLKL